MPDQAPILPPNPTADQIAAWTEQMHQFNQAHPTTSIGEDIGNWFSKNIGGVGSSRPSFPSQQPPATPSLLNKNPASNPAQALKNVLTGRQTVGPAAASPVPGGSGYEPPPADLSFEQSQPHLNGVNAQDPYNLWMNAPGRTGPAQEAPTGIDPLSQDGGTFDGPTTISSTADASGGGLSGFLKGLTGQDYLGAAGLGLGAAGMFMNASTQKDQFNQQMALQRQQLAQGQALAGLNATQMNPYAQQNDLFDSAKKREIGIYGPATAQLGSPDAKVPARDAIASDAKQFLSDSALANAAGNFEAARHHADPTGTPLDLGATGLGAAGTSAQGNYGSTQQAALQNALTAGTNQQPASTDSGSGFWHTLAKIGLMAAPIVAAPFTGGASLAAIGALSGAASGAMDGGGWKGALVGGGLGAIPGFGTPSGLAEGAAKPALTAGLEQAGKKAVTNPKLITSALSMALNH